MNTNELKAHLDCLEHQLQRNSDCRYIDLFGVPVDGTCLIAEASETLRLLTGEVNPEMQNLLEIKTCCEVVKSKLLRNRKQND